MKMLNEFLGYGYVVAPCALIGLLLQIVAWSFCATVWRNIYKPSWPSLRYGLVFAIVLTLIVLLVAPLIAALAPPHQAGWILMLIGVACGVLGGIGGPCLHYHVD
jgi:hypothetical protein